MTTPAAFFANKTVAQTGFAANNWVQVTFPNIVYNVGTYFASNAWTPPAGKIWMRANLGNGGTTTDITIEKIAIYKDGILFHEYDSLGIAGAGGGLVAEIDDTASGANVYTVYGWNPASSPQFTANEATFFCGYWFSE